MVSGFVQIALKEVRKMWYKMQAGQFDFQLLNLEVREDFSVWDNTGKRFLRDNSGEMLVGSDNVNRPVGEIKFLKREIFSRLYPSCSRGTKYVREIAVHESDQVTRYVFAFPHSANQQISMILQNSQKFGQDVLNYFLTLKKTGTGLGTQYSVIMGEQIGKPLNVVEPISTQGIGGRQERMGNQSPSPPRPKIDMGAAFQNAGFPLRPREGIMLTQREAQILGEAVQRTIQNAREYSQDEFVTGFCYTYHKRFGQTISAERATEIYEQCYKNKRFESGFTEEFKEWGIK